MFLCARHCSRGWGTNSKQVDEVHSLLESVSQWRETGNKPVSRSRVNSQVVGGAMMRKRRGDWRGLGSVIEKASGAGVF